MRILITNDDGITAPGLQTLTQIAETLAGPDGEVWTVAPAFEQSGVGHCISYTRPFMLNQHGPRRFSVDGSPADCVLTALHVVMADTPPDLVLSGVNRGNNSAENTLYSGTIGAAMEAALQGIPALALSQYYGPRNRDLADPFEAAAAHGADAVQKILASAPDTDGPYRLFYNVNFPPVPAAEVKGLRAVHQGRRAGVNFAAAAQEAPNRRRYIWIMGGDQQVETAPDTDAAVNLQDYVSVTPMRADLTAQDALEALKAIE